MPERGETPVPGPATAGARRMSPERRARNRARRRRLRVGGALALVLVLALGAGLLLVRPDERREVGGSRAASSETTSTAPGPYDFTEAGGDFSLERVKEAKFVSVSRLDSGLPRSFMLTRERPEFTVLADAVAAAEPRPGVQPPSQAGDSLELVFVTTERETVELRVGEAGEFYWRDRTFIAGEDLPRLLDEIERQVSL